ncbi:MAG: hypothetical protein RL637_1440 [Pseudomonadota bacterium]|jgi:AmpD protein
MNIQQHWLIECRRVLSPNYDLRPNEQDIGLIVIHGISLPPQQFGGSYIDQLFCNQLNPNDHPYFATIYQLKVSAHLFINRQAEITQYVGFNHRAWHCGISNYQGRERCNDFSIGIELEGVDNLPYTEIQYQQLAKVILTLCRYYPKLNTTNIVGHSDIAPGRKTDPGIAFDWQKLHQLLKNI